MQHDDFSRLEILDARIEAIIHAVAQQPHAHQGAADTAELRMALDIRSAYQAEVTEDQRSLERVLSRLLENSAANESKVIAFPYVGENQQGMPAMRNTMASFPWRQIHTRKGWMQYISLFAAVLCLTLLVGSFLAVLNTVHTKPVGQTDTASSPKTPAYQEAIYNSNYPPIDHVYCDQAENLVMHIHAHVSIYINGQPWLIPQSIGIPQDQSGNPICFYWLHTHDASGVIHVESPTEDGFTFGQFLNEWNQRFHNLGFPGQLLQNNAWTIWINGHPYHGTLASIPLAAHNLITIAYHSPHVRPDTTYAWGAL